MIFILIQISQDPQSGYHKGIRPIQMNDSLRKRKMMLIFVRTFTTPKLITLEAKDLSGGLNSTKVIIKFLSLESVVLARKRNRIDVKRLITALLFWVARAQSTFLTASEKVRRILICRCLVSISYEVEDFSGQYCLPLQG